MTNNKILYTGLALILIVVTAGFFVVNSRQEPVEDYITPEPEQVVRQYFTAWKDKNYPDMYAALSDGFKRIDPDAKDLRSFIDFASSQGVESVRIINVEEESRYETTAVVDYTVEFTLSDEKKQEFSDKFTLKYRQGDIIQGWKLIHPYGENIDAS